jgi:hypothetical protein
MFIIFSGKAGLSRACCLFVKFIKKINLVLCLFKYNDKIWMVKDFSVYLKKNFHLKYLL